MPFFGFFITDAACFHQGQTRASKIISAVEAYRSGHDDSFPATVEVLVPDYLGEIPEPACSWMTGDDGYRAGLRCMNAVPARFC